MNGIVRARGILAAGAVVAGMLNAGCGDVDRPAVELAPDTGLSLESAPAIPAHCDVAAPPAGVQTIQVVFSCDEAAVGIWRALPAGTTDTLRFAIEALLAGPTAEEEAVGLHSFFSSATAGRLNGVEVRDGVAYIDFADFSRIIPNASASLGSTMLLDQIAGTVFQFDDIREAELSFDGSCAAFWNWLQRDCERLQRSAA
jgi:hypothetical protein